MPTLTIKLLNSSFLSIIHIKLLRPLDSKKTDILLNLKEEGSYKTSSSSKSNKSPRTEKDQI